MSNFTSIRPFHISTNYHLHDKDQLGTLGTTTPFVSCTQTLSMKQRSIYTHVTHPSSLLLQPLIKPCSQEYLEEPASNHWHEGEKALWTKVGVNIRPTEAIAVCKQCGYPSKINSGCIDRNCNRLDIHQLQSWHVTYNEATPTYLIQ